MTTPLHMQTVLGSAIYGVDDRGLWEPLGASGGPWEPLGATGAPRGDGTLSVRGEGAAQDPTISTIRRG